jgi:pyruvate/2-oxoglutarate dehydrogenase complex dihydrolipoamide dehydrogenase (E3) component
LLAQKNPPYEKGDFMKEIKVDICVIGAGSGGLSLAAGASQMGASVALIEKGKMGGDCLNTGCVPSKALLAAAKCADVFRHADQFGIQSITPEVNFKEVHDHVQGVIEGIAPNDSVERFESLGVKVIKATASFKDKKTIIAGDYEIKARRFVIATGSRAAAPPILGLDQVDYLTNENIFELTTLPKHLIIIGGGPIGCEMAQAHRLLGSEVTLVELSHILPKDDPEPVNIIRQKLINTGITLYESIRVDKVEQEKDEVLVTIRRHGDTIKISGSHLLIAAGRKPNTEELNLENANIAFTPKGISVDERLRSTSNKKVFAIGDVAGSYQFTHAANYHAGIVIRNILFAMPAKVNYSALPWVTYVEPELAHVGLTEADAKAKNLTYKVLHWSFKENDRARTEHTTTGQIRVIVNKKGFVLGCNIVGEHAGELILPWCLAIQEKLKISSMANVIAPYPTLSEVSKRAAGSYYTETLFSKKTKWLVRFIQKWFP